MAAYVGAKYFVTGFTETLRAELEGTGVVVSQALPGPVESGFDEAANIVPPGCWTGSSGSRSHGVPWR